MSPGLRTLLQRFSLAQVKTYRGLRAKNLQSAQTRLFVAKETLSEAQGYGDFQARVREIERLQVTCDVERDELAEIDTIIAEREAAEQEGK